MFEQSRKPEKSVISGRTSSKSESSQDTELYMKQLKRNMTGPVQMFAEDEEEEKVQRKSRKNEDLQMKNDPAKPGTKTEIPKDIKSKMETSFGTDFGDVNIHKDSHQSANLGALAYTQGNDVHFAPGQYEPGSRKGQELLGHELTHVKQQREGRVKRDTEQQKGLNINSDTSLEKEADEMGAKAAQGKIAEVRENWDGAQRKGNDEPQKNQNLESTLKAMGIKKGYTVSIDNETKEITIYKKEAFFSKDEVSTRKNPNITVRETIYCMIGSGQVSDISISENNVTANITEEHSFLWGTSMEAENIKSTRKNYISFNEKYENEQLQKLTDNDPIVSAIQYLLSYSSTIGNVSPYKLVNVNGKNLFQQDNDLPGLSTFDKFENDLPLILQISSIILSNVTTKDVETMGIEKLIPKDIDNHTLLEIPFEEVNDAVKDLYNMAKKPIINKL